MENLDLGSARLDPGTADSSGALIKDCDASGQFAGMPGTCTLPVGYVEEDDGEPVYTVLLNGRMDYVEIDVDDGDHGFCGDGRLDAGEQCDPPDSTSCDSWCQSISDPGSASGTKLTEQPPESDHFPRLLVMDDGRQVSSISG